MMERSQSCSLPYSVNRTLKVSESIRSVMRAGYLSRGVRQRNSKPSEGAPPFLVLDKARFHLLIFLVLDHGPQLPNSTGLLVAVLGELDADVLHALEVHNHRAIPEAVLIPLGLHLLADVDAKRAALPPPTSQLLNRLSAATILTFALFCT
jgi:hypothetical protein